jgi:ABC-type spermidine/putrescine transport system permease subunit II
MSVLRPDLMMKCVIPVIMAGIIAVRGLATVWSFDAPLPAYTADLRTRRLCLDLWKP